MHACESFGRKYLVRTIFVCLAHTFSTRCHMEFQPDMINPYDFLQVSVNSSLPEIRRAYRSMALKYHEDKGGDKTVMTSINLAYSFIVREMNHMGDVTQHPKDIAQKFREFCDTQEALKSEFQCVDEEFHRAFEANHTASLPGGYGDFMQPSSGSTDIESDAYGDVQHFTAITPYEGISEIMEGSSQAGLVDGSVVTNFSAQTRTLAMADYAETFTPHIDSHNIEIPEDDVADRLSAYLIESAKPVTQESTSWSLFGLVDSMGRRLKNLFITQACDISSRASEKKI